MSRPNKIDKPTIARRKGSSITIVWNKPSEPGGKNDIYVVRLRRKDDNKTSEYNTTDRSYVLGNCDNSDKDTTFYISVKAVNKMNENYLDGPWSLELKTDCHLPINYIMYLLLVIVIAPVISTSFLSKRLYHRFKIMKDVEVELPPGLASMVATDTFVSGSIDKQKEKCGSHSSPYEELPLVKMSESRHLSGCNTGHKNVTFSLELETHVFSSSGVGIEQPDNHCVSSVNTEIIDPSSTPVNVDAEVPSPHITTTSEERTVKPGYVSFNQTEPIEKKSGYVVSEIKNVNGCIDPFYLLASVDSKVPYNSCNDSNDARPYIITTSKTQMYRPFKQTESIQKNSGYVISEINNVRRCIDSSNIPATVDAKVSCNKYNDLNDSTPYFTINEAQTINSGYVPSNQTESIQKNAGYGVSEINTASARIDSSNIPVPVDAKVPCKKCNDSNDSTACVKKNGEQTTNLGHVPFNQTESVRKNSGCVVSEINNVSRCIDSSNIPDSVDAKIPYKRCNDSNNSTPYITTIEAPTLNSGYVLFNLTEPVQENSSDVVSQINNINGCIHSSNIPAPADAKVPYKKYSDSNDWVTTNESQTIHSGYVPFNQTEPVQENSGYVVSEIKNVRDYIPFNQADSVSANRCENTKNM